jgi:hypothetical protein
MADDEPMPTNGGLKVTFSREGAVEEVRICSDSDHALMSALRILATLDAFRAGDRIICEFHRQPNLIESGLA